jgi:hypothetical protein
MCNFNIEMPLTVMMVALLIVNIVNREFKIYFDIVSFFNITANFLLVALPLMLPIYKFVINDTEYMSFWNDVMLSSHTYSRRNSMMMTMTETRRNSVNVVLQEVSRRGSIGHTNDLEEGSGNDGPNPSPLVIETRGIDTVEIDFEFTNELRRRLTVESIKQLESSGSSTEI